MKNLGALGSSVDPQKLSLTVQGIFAGGAVLIVALANSWFSVSLTTAEVTQFGVQLGAFLAEAMIIAGLIRKVVVLVYNKFRRV